MGRIGHTVKAYLRKASMHLAMKKYNECLATLALAVKHDADKKNQTEIQQLQQKCLDALRARPDMTDEEVSRRAESDPEVMVRSPPPPPFPAAAPTGGRAVVPFTRGLGVAQAILNEPVMRTILQQMQQDPRAITECVRVPRPSLRAWGTT
jgi:hypothetical protein